MLDTELPCIGGSQTEHSHHMDPPSLFLAIICTFLSVLNRALEKLLDAGLPEGRYKELVTTEVSYKVNAAVAKSVLIDLGFNMGVNCLLGFKKTLVLVAGGKYPEAAVEMMDSQWARQVGRRAERLSQMMRSGEWPEELR